MSHISGWYTEILNPSACHISLAGVQKFFIPLYVTHRRPVRRNLGFCCMSHIRARQQLAAQLSNVIGETPHRFGAILSRQGDNRRTRLTRILIMRNVSLEFAIHCQKFLTFSCGSPCLSNEAMPETAHFQPFGPPRDKSAPYGIMFAFKQFEWPKKARKYCAEFCVQDGRA